MDLPKELQEQAQEAFQQQIAQEQGMIADGISKYRREAYDSSSSFGIKPAGMAVISRVFLDLEKGIQEKIDAIDELVMSRRKGDAPFRTPTNAYYLQLTAADIAYITLQSALGVGFEATGRGILAYTLINRVATAFRHQVEVQTWIDREQEEGGRNVAKYLLNRSKNFNQRQWNIWKNKLDNLPSLTWSNKDSFKLGVELVEMLIRKGGGHFYIRKFKHRGKYKHHFLLTPEAKEWVIEYNEKNEALYPTYLPTICYPATFIWSAEDKAYIGGYHTIKNKLMTEGNISRHTSELEKPLSDEVLDAVNALMCVGFKLDNEIESVAKQCYELGNGYIDDFATEQETPLPDRVDDADWERMSVEARNLYKASIAKIHSNRAAEASRRGSAIQKFNTMNMFRDKTFWHVIRSDTRTRLYYVSGVWQPQGDQLAKATHRFSQSVPLGENGLYWIKIQLANTFGYDKTSFEDMQRWVDERHQVICRCADNPMTEKFWTEADSELLFLQACNEYREAVNATNIEKFQSTLPVYQDGSNNGLQILSMLGKDPIGAKYTNCSSDPNRWDIYQVAADKVKELLLHTNNQEMIDFWLPKIDRKLTKRATMTTPYGVSLYGISNQLMDDGFIDGTEAHAIKRAQFIAEVIKEALEGILVAATDIMDYFQEVAKSLSEESIPLIWRTPSGSLVQQRYLKEKKTQVRTILGKFVLRKAFGGGKLNKSKQVRGVSANIIHSIDASILHNVINRLNKSGAVGIISIHDSFATHAGYVSLMRDIIRRVAYETFTEDFLAEFADYYKKNYPHLELPEPPAKGEFDVLEVLSAKYFFA